MHICLDSASFLRGPESVGGADPFLPLPRYLSLSLSICIYIYIYIYSITYTHIYIYIYIHTCLGIYLSNL